MADLVVDGVWRHWENCRVGKMVKSTPFLDIQRSYDGIVESDGTVVIADPEFYDPGESAIDAIRAEVDWDGSSEPLDSDDIAAIGSALGAFSDAPGDGLDVREPPTIHSGDNAMFYERNAEAGFNPGHGTPVGSANFHRRIPLFAVPALVTQGDNFEFINTDPEWDNPNVIGVEVHPDDVPTLAWNDYGTVNGAWFTTAIASAFNRANAGHDEYTVEARSVKNDSVTGVIQEGELGYLAPYARYQDEGGVSIDFTTDLGVWIMPSPDLRLDDIDGYWFQPPITVTDEFRQEHLTFGSQPEYVTIPVIYQSGIVTAVWGGSDGNNYLHMEPRLLMDFAFDTVRYRFLYQNADIPPMRLHPREDELGVGSNRLNTAKSQQRSNRIIGGYY